MSENMGLPGFSEIMKQAQGMGRKMQEIRDRVRKERYSASVAGDMVKATVNGDGELLKLEIDETAIDPTDKEMLEDLVIAATNQAVRKSKEAYRNELNALTGGMDVAGMLGLP